MIWKNERNFTFGHTFVNWLTHSKLSIQTSSNRDLNSRFILKAIFKPLKPVELNLDDYNHIVNMVNTSQLWMCKLEYSNTWPQFDVVLDLEFRPISELFSNNDTRSIIIHRSLNQRDPHGYLAALLASGGPKNKILSRSLTVSSLITV